MVDNDTNTNTGGNDKVISSLLSRVKQSELITLQAIIDDNEREIVQSYLDSNQKLDYKSVWLKRIQNHADALKITLDTAKPSWKSIEQKIRLKLNTSASPAKSTSATASSSSTCPSLKTPLSFSDRDKVLQAYDMLDETKCWILEATRRRARIEKKEPWSVESRMRTFVSTLNYVHPSLSFILDVDDLNWTEYFNREELQELRTQGEPVLRNIPEELRLKFDEIETLKTALDAYNYGRSIEHHPIDQPLLAWLSQSLMTTSKFFIPGARTPVQNFLESDQLYYLWSLVNTIFHNSDIQALGKEKTSTANAAALNSKRKLSAVEGIEREKIGRRIDTIYIGSDLELGGLETGSKKDNTKEFEDSMLKLPLVLKDMLTKIVNERPSLLRKAHVLGYNINGNAIRLIDADIPCGYVTRIRRTDELEYPKTSDDYVFKMLSLLELAAYGKTIIEDTYALCCRTRVRPSVGGGAAVVPPSYILSDNQASSSSDSSNTTKKSRTRK